MLLSPLPEIMTKKIIYFYFSTTTFTTRCWKKIRKFPLLLVTTTSTTSWLCQKIYFPYSYCIHYAVIIGKIYGFISALPVLYLDHDKNIFFFISVLRSLGPNHEKKYFHYCYYVHSIRDHKQFFFFVAAMFTTPWLPLLPLHSG